MADADTAEKLVRNLAQRLEAILTANRRGLPAELRRSLACTNILETMNGTIRRVCRNVKHWQEAAKGAQSLPPRLRDALAAFNRDRDTPQSRQQPAVEIECAARMRKLDRKDDKCCHSVRRHLPTQGSGGQIKRRDHTAVGESCIIV